MFGHLHSCQLSLEISLILTYRGCLWQFIATVTLPCEFPKINFETGSLPKPLLVECNCICEVLALTLYCLISFKYSLRLGNKSLRYFQVYKKNILRILSEKKKKEFSQNYIRYSYMLLITFLSQHAHFLPH
jgi:hypothetical protein